MEQKFYDVMLDCPIIPAVKDNKGLEMCIQSEIKVVFVLFGDICSIGEIIAKLKDAGKNGISACRFSFWTESKGSCS